MKYAKWKRLQFHHLIICFFITWSSLSLPESWEGFSSAWTSPWSSRLRPLSWGNHVHIQCLWKSSCEKFRSGKTELRFWWNFAYFQLIFCRISAYDTPSAVFPPTCLQILPISSLFHLFSVYFLPKMVPHPCYKLNHDNLSAYFLPMFRSFSAYFPPNLPLILCWSCLAMEWHGTYANM